MAGRKLTAAAGALALLAVGAVTARAQETSVTLQQALDMARKVNPAIIQAEGNLDNAGASKLQAFGSWLPSLSASSGYSTQPGRERLDPTTNTFITPTSSSA